MFEWLMDRYRGRPGLFGRIVLLFDVRWLKHVKRIADQVKDQ